MLRNKLFTFTLTFVQIIKLVSEQFQKFAIPEIFLLLYSYIEE